MTDPRTIDIDNQLRERAWKILRSPGGDPEELLELALQLRGRSRFGLARRLLERAREDQDRITDPSLSLELRQKHAFCTYKDPDLPKQLALSRALEILDHEGDLKETRNQETLGIAGAIYKRKWQVDARKAHLERSLIYYYERGHKEACKLRKGILDGQEIPSECDRKRVLEGYTSINAAFILDLLASLEEQESQTMGSSSTIADERRKLGREVREELVDSLGKLMTQGLLSESYWTLASIAEAHFGLGDFSKAGQALEKAKRLDPEPWMLQTTAEQLASAALLRPGGEGAPEKLRDSEAWQTLDGFLEGGAEAVSSLFHGKLGLALSGGGFRAAFFHIGVLARLAELDLLRHVHVLSCVSGGSIVGTHYYLEVRKLLQEKWDLEDPSAEIPRPGEEVIEKQDYVEIVERVAKNFLAGVERNLRTRVAGSFLGNLKMAFWPGYSRTNRLGELLEKEIYSRVDDGSSLTRYLDELLIQPRGKQHFVPKNENWRRRNKVPMLVLNATSLNTGHSWQFTGTWMGESPFSTDEEIDGNWRFRRMWYAEAPEAYQPSGGKKRIRLGTAVGASACVPGIFEPIVLTELYPKESENETLKEMNVRLVDGGVHDNQGIASLLEQDCSVIIVSDASGQMTSQNDPGGGILGPLLRTNSVLMERVRQAQFQDLKGRLRAGLLKKLMVVHLKKGLLVDPIDWKECEEPPDIPLRRRSDLLEYGVLREVQQLLAGVRTDLDSFTEVEADALMASGYLMASTYARDLEGFPMADLKAEDRGNWSFLRIEKPLFTRGESASAQKRVVRMLSVASQKAFKIWSLSPPLKGLAFLLAGLLMVAFGWLWWSRPGLSLISILPDTSFFGTSWRGLSVNVNGIGLAASLVLLALLLNRIIGRVLGKAATSLIQWRETLWKLMAGTSMALVGSLLAQLHLLVFDRMFKARGRIKRALH